MPIINDSIYLLRMRILILTIVMLMVACGPKQAPGPELLPDSTAVPEPAGEPGDNSLLPVDPYQRWLMNEYDIFQFLRTNPTAEAVIQTLGQPDSVFMDFEQTTRILYYYIPKLDDYNSVEIETGTGKVSGFEWD